MYKNVHTNITIKEKTVQMFNGTGFGKNLKKSIYRETSAVICDRIENRLI